MEKICRRRDKEIADLQGKVGDVSDTIKGAATLAKAAKWVVGIFGVSTIALTVFVVQGAWTASAVEESLDRHTNTGGHRQASERITVLETTMPHILDRLRSIEEGVSKLVDARTRAERND